MVPIIKQLLYVKLGMLLFSGAIKGDGIVLVVRDHEPHTKPASGNIKHVTSEALCMPFPFCED